MSTSQPDPKKQESEIKAAPYKPIETPYLDQVLVGALPYAQIAPAEMEVKEEEPEAQEG